MKIAVISDVHGNIEALRAVLDDIQSFKPDSIVCAGDIVNPFKTSLEVYKLIKELNIPMIRGNHEDYIIRYHTSKNSAICNSVQYQPIRLVAETFSIDEVNAIKNWPLHISIKHPSGKHILVCHASPYSNAVGYLSGVSKKIEKELLSFNEELIICGHWHERATRTWNNKTLAIIGSVGLPMEGEPAANYLRLSFVNQHWKIEHKSIPYNHLKAVQSHIDSGFVKKGGPIGWVILDELISSQKRMSPLFPWLKTRGLNPSALLEWETVIKDYLMSLGRWDAMKKYI